MKRFNYLLGILAISMAGQSYADEVLSGRVKLSCEAILCLSTGSPPGECNPSLSEYFSINYDDFGDTIRERINFLNLCPVSNQDSNMRSLVNAIANGAGRCDAASLNATNTVWRGMGYPVCVSDAMPSYCSAYVNHQYTKINPPVYVIDPPPKYYNPYGSNALTGLGIGNQAANIKCGHWVDGK